ncbi:MAG TPA: hypothetical protein VJZ00_16430 [Thermoanaerobaculia bacterium]|nr:hypothetical protein [Thermoanaerobaculia bacterium]
MNEDALYEDYIRGIEVPPMWDAIEARIRAGGAPGALARRPTAEAAVATLAAAAMLLAAILTIVRLDRTLPNVSSHYQRAIAQLERDAPPSPMMFELTRAIAVAERAAADAPNDPVAVTRLVDAYDAKLQMLRMAADAR